MTPALVRSVRWQNDRRRYNLWRCRSMRQPSMDCIARTLDRWRQRKDCGGSSTDSIECARVRIDRGFDRSLECAYARTAVVRIIAKDRNLIHAMPNSLVIAPIVGSIMRRKQLLVLTPICECLIEWNRL